MYSALGADFSALMRYINSRFTYLLTYLLTYIEEKVKVKRLSTHVVLYTSHETFRVSAVCDLGSRLF